MKIVEIYSLWCCSKHLWNTEGILKNVLVFFSPETAGSNRVVLDPIDSHCRLLKIKVPRADFHRDTIEEPVLVLSVLKEPFFVQKILDI